MQNPQPNPYTPDEPVREAGRFFGREESLNWIDQRLSQHALIVVHGPPRIGISSLLIQLCQRVADRYQPTYLLIEGQSPREVMQQVTQTASVGVGLPAIASPQALREALGDSLYDAGRKPVLIALDGLPQWETRAKVDLLNALAALAATSGMLRFVVGWGVLPENGVNRDMPLRLDGLAAPANPIAQLRLSPLTRLHAMQLIADTARDRLKYDYHALERIWQESGGRPAMLQLIGCEVYERRALVGRASARDVQLALDDAVIRLAREMTEQWQYYTRQEQLVIGAAATVRGEHGLFSINHVLRELAANHVTFTADEVRDALAHLAQLDMVEPAGMKTYRFSSGLIRAWAARHAALPVVIGDTPVPVIPLAFDVISRRRARVWRAVRWLLLALAIAFVVTGPTIVSSLGPAPAPAPTAAAPAATLTPEGGRPPTRAPAVLPTLAKPVPVIAYSARKSDKEKWRVYVANQDGADPVALTSGFSDDRWPTWSPDGAKIAFSSNRDGHWEIYTMSADGGEQIRITNHASAHNWSASWSPDGLKLIFSSFRDRNWEIYTMNRDGSGAKRLTDDPAEDLAPVWSPDGRVIAFASKRSGNHEIYLMNPDGSGLTRLTETNANSFNPSWSPDSRRLAFDTFRDGNWEIYLMNGDGSEVKNLTNSPSADQAPSWSPDGQWIAFQSNRDGASDIWVMRADGRDPRNWTHGATSAENPAWRPASKK